MSLRLSSSCHSGSRQIHYSRKQRVKFAAMSSPCWSFFRHPRQCTQGIYTPWSNHQWQVLLWGFEVDKGGHSVQTSRQVEEKQLVSPPWQRACSQITCCSTIPDFQKHYSDSPHPIFTWPPPWDFFLFPKMKLWLKGHRFDTTEEIHAEMQEVIKTLTFENFQGCLKSWETR